MTDSRHDGVGKKGRPVVRFFNTVEPVISLYRLVGEKLLQSGFDVEIVVTGASYRTQGKPLALWAKANGVRILSLPGVASYPRRALGKALVACYYALFATIYSMFSRSAAVNVFLTQPPMFFTLGRMLRMARRQPYVCITMDMYPDVLVAFGKLRDTGLLHRLLHRIAYGTLARADAVVSIGRCMSERLILSGVAKARVHLIPNWAEAKLAADEPASEENSRQLLTDLGLGDRFVVLYSGNMGAAHTFDELIEAAVRLRSDERICFLIVGEGVRKQTVAQRIRVQHLDNVHMLPYQEPGRAARLMAEVDVHLVTQRGGFEGLVVPSKAYSALAAGRPLIYVGRKEGEIARMVVEESLGYVVALQDGGALARACSELADNPDERARIRQRALALALDRYGSKRAACQYAATIREAAGL